MQNHEIADILNQVADKLEILGRNPFRIRSYRDAARIISSMSGSLSALENEPGKISDLPGIGESLSKKISEILQTGTLKQLERLNKKVPPSLSDIMKLQYLGPVRTRRIYLELGIESIDELEKAAREGLLNQLKGFGEKTTEGILQQIQGRKAERGHKRFRLDRVETLADALQAHLEKETEKITLAGSYRRRKETVGDLDILATSHDPVKAIDRLSKFKKVNRILSKGKTKTSVVLKSGIQVDLRIVKKISYGAALLYFTGSKEHNITLRKMAQRKDLKLNEYGIFKANKRLASKTEEDMYRELGLEYIEPELREGLGEIEASLHNDLPELISSRDIMGDLQMHTSESDGSHSMEEMLKAAVEAGYAYVAITDHSKKISPLRGLDKKKLEEQIQRIEFINSKQNRIRVLKSAEVNILKDGSLDLEDSLLKELDMVLCSIHSDRNLSKKEQTLRILKAMDHPSFNILAHPTGRVIGKRKQYDVNMGAVMKGAMERGCFLEINASPYRLDLKDIHIRMAKELGLKLAISSDAHSPGNLKYMKYGVAQARRGWLEKKDVLNTRPWPELRELLHRN